MQLTRQQLSFFDTFGYLGFPGLFADEIDRMTDAFERGGRTIVVTMLGGPMMGNSAPPYPVRRPGRVPQ